MNESSQAIVAVKRDVQLSEWQRQVQERQEQGIPVDEWCASLGISKGAYYHRLIIVCERFGHICVNRWGLRWLLEGLELEQPKAIKESKPGILY